MKEISLTQGKITLVDDSDYVYLSQYRWYAKKSRKCWYAVRNIPTLNHKQTTMRMHRVILSAPDEMQVDHINGDSLNNKRSNLRLCTRAENGRNRGPNPNNKTGFKGVRFNKRNRERPYYAQIHLGCYKTAKEAARAYDIAAIEHYGEFALTNETLGLL